MRFLAATEYPWILSCALFTPTTWPILEIARRWLVGDQPAYRKMPKLLVLSAARSSSLRTTLSCIWRLITNKAAWLITSSNLARRTAWQLVQASRSRTRANSFVLLTTVTSSHASIQHWQETLQEECGKPRARCSSMIQSLVSRVFCNSKNFSSFYFLFWLNEWIAKIIWMQSLVKIFSCGLFQQNIISRNELISKEVAYFDVTIFSL